jgi:hypothetical protein
MTYVVSWGSKVAGSHPAVPAPGPVREVDAMPLRPSWGKAGASLMGIASRKATRIREFTDASPAELLETASATTAIQAAKILESHYDKWLRASGPLDNVTPWDRDFGFSMVTLSNYQLTNQINFFFNDRKTVEDRLGELRPGTQLTIVGKISEIRAHNITLKKCEIESVTAESDTI